MQAMLKHVDCILELHDARVPLGGRNSNFASMLTAIKPHVLLLNKMDLADPSQEQEVVDQLRAQGTSHVLHIKSSEPSKNINKIVPLVVDLIRSSERYNRREVHFG